MTVSMADFYSVFSSKIFKAEIKEFKAIFYERYGLGHTQVNKLEKLPMLSIPWMI